MTKLDLRTELKRLYTPSSREVEVVNVPRFPFVMMDGELDPGEFPAKSPAFQEAVEAVYAVAYALKFMSKKRERNPIEFPVMPLEALWWTDDSGAFLRSSPEPWNFTAMILQPKHITARLFAQVIDGMKRKGAHIPPGLRLEIYREGLCVQMLHIGPYAGERESLDQMHDFADVNGYRFAGKHHEVYLGDPRRTKPERLKTILRQPVARMR